MKTKLSKQETAELQQKIIEEGLFPDTEQFGHLEYFCSYTVEGRKYLFHKKTLMDVEVYRIES